MDAILEARSITKDFPGVRALDNVSFALEESQIHALCGENGAGKSTFINVLSGVFPSASYTGKSSSAARRRSSPRSSEAEAGGHRRHPPGAQPLPRAHRGGEHLHGPRDRPPRHPGLERDVLPDHEWIRKLKLGDVAAHHEGEGPGHRQAAADRDRAGAAPSPHEDPDPRRAHRLPHRVRDRPAPGHPARAEARRALPASTSPTRSRRSCRSPTASRSCATARPSGGGEIGDLTRKDIVRLMVGREITEFFPKEHHVDIERVRAGGEDFSVTRPRHGKADREATPAFACTAGRSSACSAWSARAAPSWPAASSARRRESSGRDPHRGSEGRLRLPARRAAQGLAYVTEDRKAQGIIPTMNVRENASIAFLDRFAGLPGHRREPRDRRGAVQRPLLPDQDPDAWTPASST